MARNYRQEYDSFHKKPEQKKNRAKRNADRTKAKKSGAKVAGKDVDHTGSPGRGPSGKTKVTSVKSNRSKNGHRPGEKQNRKKK
jgi:hypothetical protein